MEWQYKSITNQRLYKFSMLTYTLCRYSQRRQHRTDRLKLKEGKNMPSVIPNSIFTKLGNAIRKAEEARKVKAYSILNNFMHNVDKCHDNWKIAGNRLNTLIQGYELDFKHSFEEDTKVEWNDIMYGYMSYKATP